ncbi:hypothetical protein HY358_00460 [Candidatus Roizmanbacteria bacterium]|nr:hypothetical protein [Candidatus Roizmanbacteria bacterium]
MTETAKYHEKLVEEQAYKTAIDAAITAGERVRQYWPNPLNPDFDKRKAMEIFDKSEGIGNFATTADMESEDIIVGKIQDNPLLTDHRIRGEEKHEIITESEWEWINDPIDGTLNFNIGDEQFCIATGVRKGNEMVIGVIALPAKRQLIAARKDKAVLLSFDGKILIDDLRNIETKPTATNRLLVAYDLGYTERDMQLRNVVSKVAGQIAYPKCLGSISYSNALIALGLLHGNFVMKPTIYDIAAASKIVSAVGGISTNMEGKPHDWTAPTRTYLAGRTPQIHQQLLTVINS